MLNNLLDFFQITDKYLTYLSDKIEFSNDGFPIFTKEMFLEEEPEMIIPYYNRHNKLVKEPSKTVICFFGADSSLYHRLEKVLNELDEYRQFQGVIGLDVTVTADMDPEWQNAIMLLNQLFLAVLACNGIKIVMNARIGSPGTVKNLCGFPKNIVCATGFLGCDKLSSDSDLTFISKILYLMPSKLLIYGKHDKIAEKQLTMMGIDYRVYPDLHRLCKGVA